MFNADGGSSSGAEGTGGQNFTTEDNRAVFGHGSIYPVHTSK